MNTASDTIPDYKPPRFGTQIVTRAETWTQEGFQMITQKIKSNTEGCFF
jgi:hypothetical protein